MEILKYKGLDVNPANLTETMQVKNSSSGVLSLKESESGESFVMPRIESIHAGKTANNVYYPADKLKGDKSLGSGVYSWTEPYAKPVIYNHDMMTETTGRVVRAAYSEYTQAGKPGIFVVPKITEPNAVQAVRDGRLLTVSIGATTNQAICSICGTDIINEGYCGHMKGEEYDGEEAHWITGDVFFNELSWVNQPADSNAFVVDTDTSGTFAMSDTEESLHNKNIHEYYGVPKAIPLVEAVSSTEVKEGITEVSKKKSLNSLKEATKKAKDFLEAIEIEIQSFEIEPGQTVEVPYTGNLPAGATISVDKEMFTVELGENQEILLTADEQIEDADVELNFTISAGGQTLSQVVEVIIASELDDKEDNEDEEKEDEPKDEGNEEEPVEGDTEPESEDSVEPEGGESNAGEGDPEPESTDPEEPEESNEEDNELSEAIETATVVIEELQASNQVLKAQNKVLIEELKESYIEKINAKHDGNLSEEYIEKLRGRHIDSLKETIEDLESGFFQVNRLEKPAEPKTRTVKQVKNPIQESEEKNEKKDVTQEQVTKFLGKLLSK